MKNSWSPEGLNLDVEQGDFVLSWAPAASGKDHAAQLCLAALERAPPAAASPSDGDDDHAYVGNKLDAMARPPRGPSSFRWYNLIPVAHRLYQNVEPAAAADQNSRSRSAASMCETASRCRQSHRIACITYPRQLSGGQEQRRSPSRRRNRFRPHVPTVRRAYRRPGTARAPTKSWP